MNADEIGIDYIHLSAFHPRSSVAIVFSNKRRALSDSKAARAVCTHEANRPKLISLSPINKIVLNLLQLSYPLEEPANTGGQVDSAYPYQPIRRIIISRIG